MQTEFEATFERVDRDKMRQKLQSIGAVLKKSEFLQKRMNFAPPSESPMKEGWVRIRDEADQITMSIKAILHNNSMDGQKEVNLVIDDFENAKEFLEQLGCRYKSYQESKREIWILDGVEICIDEWPWLEPFVEIEGTSEDGVRQVAERLGLHYDAEAIFGAVDVQYERKYGVTKRVINEKTSRIVFGEKCPFIS